MLSKKASNHYKITRLTVARINFDNALTDLRTLLSIHDRETQQTPGKPDRGLEVLKRAGVILAVTAWETFVEDTLTQQFKERMREALSPSEVQSAFNAAAEDWLYPKSDSSSRPKPPGLAKWAESGWKNLVWKKFKQDIAALHTPNSKNVRKLFKRYLGLDVTGIWKWQGISSDRACQRLDSLIALRGSIVHRGKELSEDGPNVHRDQLVDTTTLVERLVQCTEVALGVAPETLE